MSPSLKSYRNRDLIVVHWMEKMENAKQVMHANGVRHLPVIDDAGAIVGLLSDRDFLKHPLGEDLMSAEVRSFMSWPVEAIDEGFSLAEAAKRMVESRVSSLIVVSGEDVVGLITTEDLLRAFIEDQPAERGELKTELAAAVYNSPINGIMQTLANAGI